MLMDMTSDKKNLSLRHSHQNNLQQSSMIGAADFWVSSKSLFRDNQWWLDHVAAGNRRYINFNKTLWNNKKLTDPELNTLLNSVKCFLWSLWVDSPENRCVCSSGGLLFTWELLSIIVGWMLEYGYYRFDELDESAIEVLMLDLATKPRRQGTKVHHTYLRRYFNLLESLWLQRKKLDDGLWFNPLGEQSPHQKAIEFIGYSDKYKRTPCIPELQYIHILQTALQWVEIYSQDILQLLAIQQRYKSSQTRNNYLAISQRDTKINSGTPTKPISTKKSPFKTSVQRKSGDGNVNARPDSKLSTRASLKDSGTQNLEQAKGEIVAYEKEPTLHQAAKKGAPLQKYLFQQQNIKNTFSKN